MQLTSGDPIIEKETGEQAEFVEYLPLDDMYDAIVRIDGERIAVVDISRWERASSGS